MTFSDLSTQTGTEQQIDYFEKLFSRIPRDDLLDLVLLSVNTLGLLLDMFCRPANGTKNPTI